jgi:hypothetical protein
LTLSLFFGQGVFIPPPRIFPLFKQIEFAVFVELALAPAAALVKGLYHKGGKGRFAAGV